MGLGTGVGNLEGILGAFRKGLALLLVLLSVHLSRSSTEFRENKNLLCTLNIK